MGLIRLKVYSWRLDHNCRVNLIYELYDMIIQEVLKGISGIDEDDVHFILASGIICNWWRKVGVLPSVEVMVRTEVPAPPVIGF